jgi:hypothetical protein
MVHWYVIESSSISIDDVCSIINMDEPSFDVWNVDFQYYKGENANFLLVTDSSMPDLVLVKDGLNWIHFERNFISYLPRLLSSSSLKVRQHQTLSGVFCKDEAWIGAFKGRIVVATIKSDFSLHIAQSLNQSDTFIEGLKCLSDRIIK